MTHQGDAAVVSAAVQCRREEPRAAAEEVMHSGYRTKFRIESAKVKVGEIDPTQKKSWDAFDGTRERVLADQVRANDALYAPPLSDPRPPSAPV